MLCAAKMATFRRVARRALHHFLALVIAVSTLSAISIPQASAASGAVTSGACSSTVGETSTVTVAVVGNDCVITFTSGINSWTVPANVAEIDLLVIGGGGAGGTRSGGGGGAGGYVYLTSVSVTPAATINLAVGAGGANTNTNTQGLSGSDSSFSLSTVVTAKGGGGGGTGAGSSTHYAGLTGGSSGGSDGSNNATNTPGAANQGSLNYGHGTSGALGSNGSSSVQWTGGGGGGAGGAGVAGNTNGTAGAGGAGRSNSITGSSVCYAAGGGGGNEGTSTNSAGAGGSCGGTAVGGAGSKGNSVAGNGNVNTGSGGGGSGFQDPGGNGTPGNGGSGVVIVRWTLPSAAGAFPNVSGMSARFNANNFNTTLNSANGTWADTSGNGFHIAGADIAGASTGAMSVQTSSNANGAANSFTVVQGTTASSISMLTAAEMTGKYTLFTVARYNAGQKLRIFQGQTGNYLHGFHYLTTGVLYKEGWTTAQDDPYVNNWVLGSECSHDPSPVANSCLGTYSAQGKQRSYVASTNATAFGLAVNTGANVSGADSDYQIADVLVFNRVLTIKEVNLVETYISTKYGIAIFSDVIASYDPGDSTTTNKLIKNLGKGDGTLVESLDMTLYNNTSKSAENSGSLKFSFPNGSHGQTTSPMRPVSRFSASSWFKQTGTQVNAWNSIITGVGSVGNVIAPVIATYNNNVNAGFYDGGTWRTGYANMGVEAYPISNDVWYHVVTTYDGVNVRIYVNGILRSTTASTASVLRDGMYLRMGARWDATNFSLNGSIGKTKVYDNALTDAEVLAEYNADTSKYVCASSSQSTSAGTVITFTNPGSCNWTAPTGVTTIRAVVVGGGGGGGAWVGGGGGGGGVIDSASISVTAGTTYPIVVGGGGKGAYLVSNGAISAASLGSNTTAFSLTAYGGGGGGSWNTLGTSGATGGGGSYNNTVTSSYTSQGFAGGKDAYNGDLGYATGGGGGAGAVGGTATTTSTTSQSGAGGAGKETNITGSASYFGGGGGGGCHGNANNACSVGIGGVGGGGGGARWTSAITTGVVVGTSGTANTGGGGGGSGSPYVNTGNVDSQGGEGGSGTVIILIPAPAAPTITSQPTGITKTVGQSHTFSVTATISGGGTLSYQWRKNGTNISGATSSTLAFNPIAMADSADYSVVVTNTFNGLTSSTTSNTSILYVEAIPVSTASTPTVSATTNTLKSISVSWTAVSNADTYVVNLYRVADGVKVFFTAVFSGTSLTINADNYSGIGNDTSYDVGILAIGSGNYTSATSESTKARVRTNAAYTITYNYNGATSGNGTASADFISGGTALTLPTPSKTGSSFDGWFEASNLSGSALSSSYSPSQTRTIYAKWSVNSQTITYAAGTGGGGTGPTTPLSVNYGATFTTPANTFSRNGYNFAGWSDGTNTYAAGATYPLSGTISANVTLTATWTVNSQTITYAAGTGGGGSAPTTPLAVNFGATFTTPANTYSKTGYTFAGWSDGTNTYNAGVTYPSTGSVSGNVTLTATWTANTQTITYSAGTGGSGSAPTTPTTVSYASTFTTPANTYTRAGYTFAGWSDGTSVFAAGATYPSTGTITANVSLTATWTADSLTVTYNSQSGSSVSSGTVATGANISAAPTAPTRDGYTFTGWSASSSGSVITFPYAHGQTASFSLYAIWSANTLTVTYNSQSGTAVSSGSVNTGASISSAPTAPTRTGYAFSGWSSSSSGSVITFPYAHGQTSSFTLYAIWSANSLTVTFNSQSGSSVNAGSTNTAATISSAPTAPTRAGYTFSGWSTTDSGSVITFPYIHGQTADFTLYAIWSADTLTITFDVNGGSSVTSSTTTTGTSISSAPVAPTKANYTFAGWSATNGGSAVTFPYTHGKTADFILYAKWTANTYTLTYVYNSATAGNTTATDSFTTGGTQITLPTPTRSGYTFGGWYAESGLTTSIGAAGASYSPTGSSLTPSAYAKWTALNYSVTYETTNSTGGAAPTDTTNYNIGNAVVIKGNTGSLARTGYTFTGWTAASDGTGTLLNSGSTFTTSTSNMSFYPKWSANTYTVTYNKNGATGSPTAATASYTTGSTAVTLTTVGTMVKTGFNFGGWSTTSTGSAHSGTFTTTVDVTLYAVWTIKSISISFDKGIASGVTVNNFPTNTSLEYGSTLTLAGNITSTVVISSAAHAFVGWSFGGNIYRGGDTFLIGETAPTFTAEWVKVFAVRYVMNGGTAAASSSEVDAECTFVDGSDLRCTENQVITVNAAPTRAGFTFGGWVNQGSQSVTAAATTTITSTNYLFYATWTPIDYAISYNTNQGSVAPTSFTKRLGETFVVASAPTRTGYTFSSWSDGSTSLGAGATYYVSTSAVTLSAQWIANVYTVSFDWNGGTGSATSNVSYTVGNTAITLPLVGDHVKDGYSFSGWSETSNGNLISGGYTPTADATLYAIWGSGSYTVTFNAGGGTVSAPSSTVQNGTSFNFPTPTRANFVFEGWYSANTGGTLLGNAGASFQPTQSRTAYARWTQSSLYGLAPSALTRIGTTTASSGSNSTFTSSNSNSSVSVTVPAGALPNGTTVNFDLVGDFTRAQSVLTGTNSYVISLVVSWLATDGTVPDTVTDKPISLTISNSSIKTGMSVYAIVAGNVTLLGTASQDGTVTVNLRSDPEVVVVATKPNAPTSVTATSTGIKQSAISWTAPASDGGSSITGYTATSNTGATCTTSTTSCSVTGLADGTSYTFTVTATNVLGTSVASSSSSSVTTASSYVVTFDSKSGSTVANGNFFTSSTVAAPTAPTKAGYSFDGWSATDGGTAVTFPYAPGVTIGITLYARWLALDNAVTFDSKGGSAVTSSTFASGGSVSEPTAPTRSNYTFAGWSATDGGTAVTFPYAPGVVTAITLYAKWNAVSQGGGGGGGSPAPTPSTPAPTEPVVPSTPVKSNVTVVAPVTVIGDQDAKVIAVDIAIPAPGSNTTPPAIKVDKASEKFIAGVKIVEGNLVLTPETGFSGKKTVTVTITENGTDRFVQIPLTVLPEAVTKPVLTPTASNRSLIRWTESPNADGYTVFLNGKKICATTALSCIVRNVLGPKANIEIVSNGGDRTVSQRVDAEFRQNVPVPITRLVSATITKATLTKVDTKALDQVVALIKNQGFGTVVISEITTTSKTKALAAARIESIKKYITSKVGTEEVEFEVTPVKSRTYFNNISVKG
jgi:uncharacterized repeat protein (TIGR02543 family)